MFLVETSTISLHQRRHPRVTERMAASAPELLFTSIVTVEEQLRGRLSVITSNFNNPRRVVYAYVDLEQTVHYFRTWQVLPFTDEDLDVAFRLRRQGIRIGTRDLRIATSTLNRRLTVVTNNLSDFNQVPGLAVEDWSA